MTSIICIGIAVMDQIFTLDSLPKEGGKYFANNYLEVGGGPAATAAVTIAKLGGQVEFWGRVGDGKIGDRIIEELNSYGVNTEYVKRIPAAQSSISAVLVDKHGERLIINRPTPGLDPDPSWLPLERIASQNGVLADSRWTEGAELVFKMAKAAGIPALLDADSTPDNQTAKLVEVASHVAFSENGLNAMAAGENVISALKQVNKDYEAWVCVTQGSKGTFWLDQEQLKSQPAYSVDVIDTLGAGDVFHGALIFALADGLAIPEAIKFSSATAALKCTQLGGRAGIPTREAVENLIKRNN
jgi:sulfofructose kinase